MDTMCASYAWSAGESSGGRPGSALSAHYAASHSSAVFRPSRYVRHLRITMVLVCVSGHPTAACRDGSLHGMHPQESACGLRRPLRRFILDGLPQGGLSARLKPRQQLQHYMAHNLVVAVLMPAAVGAMTVR